MSLSVLVAVRSRLAVLAVIAVAICAIQAGPAVASGQAPTCYGSAGTFNNGGYEAEAGEDEAASIGCSDNESDPLTITTDTAPAHGTLSGIKYTQSASGGSPYTSGSFKYKAATGYSGNDSFKLKISDGSNTVVVTYTVKVVAAKDDPPTCTAGFSGNAKYENGRFIVEAGEGAAGSINCRDDEGKRVALTVATPPAHGTISAITTYPAGPDAGEPGASTYGTFTYTPDASYRGNDSFAIKGNDGTSNSNAEPVPVNVVTPTNDAPICIAGFVGTFNSSTGRSEVESGDAARGSLYCSDDENDPLSYSVVDAPDHGTLSAITTETVAGAPSTTFTYTSAAGYTGPESFKLKANDGKAGDSNVVTVAFDVVAVKNDPPVCYGNVGTYNSTSGRYEIEQGDSASGSFFCTDDEKDSISYTVDKSPDHGTLGPINTGGPFGGPTVAYTPTANYTGSDGFKIKASDGSNTTTITFSFDVVAQRNDPPVCFGQLGGSGGSPGFPGGPGSAGKVETGEAEKGSVYCTDDEGDPLAFTVGKTPAHGQVGALTKSESFPGSSGATASFTYTATAPYTGADDFSITVKDGPNTTVVPFSFNVVAASNDAPSCFGYLFGNGPTGAVEAGDEAQGYVSCSDDEGNALTYTTKTTPTHGTVGPITSSDMGASFTYTADKTYKGGDSFQVAVGDGTNTTTVNIAVTVTENVDDPPACSGFAGSYSPVTGEYSPTVEQGEKADGYISCFDDEGKPITYSVEGAPAHGSLSPITTTGEEGNAEGTFRYTPSSGYKGADSFTIKASDGTKTTSIPISLTVIEAKNDAPQCVDRYSTVTQPDTVTVSVFCSDQEGDSLSYKVGTGPAHGTVTPSGDSAFVYKPADGYTGQDSFTYSATDPSGATSGIKTARITVEGADPITLSPNEDTPETGTTHKVLASIRTAAGSPRGNVTVRWKIGGNGGELADSKRSNASGQVEIPWSRTTAGADTLTAYIDENNNASRDQGEPMGTAKAYWRTTREVAPPTAGAPTKPDGSALNVPVQTQIDPDNPGERFFSVSRSQTSAAGVKTCPGGGSESRLMNLPISVKIAPGGGTVKSGTVSLFQVGKGQDGDAPTLDPPGVLKPASVAAGTYAFTLPCVRTGELFVRYTLTEGGKEVVYTVPVGGVTLIDPQGVVYDKDAFDQAKGQGRTDDQARAAAAIAGAKVTLQRKIGDSFDTLLSGDPGISPNVNPQVTGSDGKFQWDVSAGTYRVVVEKAGYPAVTSDAVVIPPPKLDLHIAMKKTTVPTDPGPTTTNPTTPVSPATSGTPSAPGVGSGGAGGAGGGSQTPASKPVGGCASKSGPARAACETEQRITAKCAALKGSKKSVCARKIRAVAKCQTIKASTKKGRAKRKSCLAKANTIGKPKKKTKKK